VKINILLFGRLTELLERNQFQLENIADTDSLTQQLHELYPALKEINYQIGVDQVIIHANKELRDGMTVALMPPFSGG